MIKISRSTKELLIKIKKLQEDFLKQGKELTIENMANILKTSKEEIAFALDCNIPIESIDEPIYNNETSKGTKIIQITNKKNETEGLINKLCLQKIIEELENREKEIIILRYYNNKTQKEVAKHLGISQVQVSRIEKKILLDMRNKIDI